MRAGTALYVGMQARGFARTEDSLGSRANRLHSPRSYSAATKVSAPSYSAK